MFITASWGHQYQLVWQDEVKSFLTSYLVVNLHVKVLLNMFKNKHSFA